MTPPTDSLFKSNILEECQRSMLTISNLILQLKSMVWYEWSPHRPESGETQSVDLEECVLQMVLELRDNLGELARRVTGESKGSEHFMNEVDLAIADCYNSIQEKFFKYVGSVKLEGAHQNFVNNRQLEAIKSKFLYAQREKTSEENLEKRRRLKVIKLSSKLVQ